MFDGSAKHLWSMFCNKSHIAGRPDVLAQGSGFQSVLTYCSLSQMLFFHKRIVPA